MTHAAAEKFYLFAPLARVKIFTNLLPNNNKLCLLIKSLLNNNIITFLLTFLEVGRQDCRRFLEVGRQD